ncbi:MAG: tripartite tricarboxylate transporter substrate binding protein [Burkholderiales bacterium]|nr:tripartite tricarboxylate transporter substrate binding protein [Burkholderiales bacterium]
MNRRRRILGAAAAAPLTLATRGFAQGAYPTRAIRMIVPFTPGGALDTVARAVTPIASERLGQQIVIENRPGGFTMIGNDMVAKAPPDGYTLLFAAAPIAFNSALGLKIPYDPLTDFEYVSLVARIPGILIVHPSVPARNVRELVEYAKKEAAEKGSFQYASAGVGTMGHLLGEHFFSAQGIKTVHVGYKGSVPALQDLVGGQTRVLIDAYIPSGPQILSGRARGLALASGRRTPVLPDVPTFAEAGFPGFEGFGFYGVAAPARTPRAIVDRLNAAFVAAATDRKVLASLVSSGYEVSASSPAEYRSFVQRQIALWTPVVKRAGITVQQ